MRYCSNCGNLNDTDAKSCQNCGKALGNAGFDTSAEEVQNISESAVELKEDAAEAEEAIYEAPETVISKDRLPEPDAESENAQAETPHFYEDRISEPDIKPEYTPAAAAVFAGSGPETEKADTSAEAAADEKPVRTEHTAKGRVFGIIGFILSVEAICVCLIPFCNIITLIEAIIGLIFCNISIKNTTFKLANIGKVLSIIAIVFSAVTIVLYIAAFVALVLYAVNNPNIQDNLFRFYSYWNY